MEANAASGEQYTDASLPTKYRGRRCTGLSVHTEELDNGDVPGREKVGGKRWFPPFLAVGSKVFRTFDFHQHVGRLLG